MKILPKKLLDIAFAKVIEWDKIHSKKSSPISQPTVTGNSSGKTATSRVPTPSIMAQRPLAGASTDSNAQAEIVYSSGANQNGYRGDAAYEQNELAAAEEIGGKVAESWLAVTTQAEVLELLADKPQLPLEIDRTLLKDCAQVLGEWTTDQRKIRRVLRSAFWEYLDLLM